jgi:Amino acid kinase family
MPSDAATSLLPRPCEINSMTCTSRGASAGRAARSARRERSSDLSECVPSYTSRISRIRSSESVSFKQLSRCASFERSTDVLIPAVHRQHNYASCTILLTDGADCLESAHPRQLEVHQSYVPPERRRPFSRQAPTATVPGRGSLSGDSEPGRDHLYSQASPRMKPSALAYLPSHSRQGRAAASGSITVDASGESTPEVRPRYRVSPATSDEPARVRGVRVLKFGGSSLATPQRIRDVGRIVVDALTGPPAVVVVSAFQGVTNQLLECARLAERRSPAYEALYDEIAARHRSSLDALVGAGDHPTRVLVDEQLDQRATRCAASACSATVPRPRSTWRPASASASRRCSCPPI